MESRKSLSSRHLCLYCWRGRGYRDGNKGTARRVWVCKEGLHGDFSEDVHRCLRSFRLFKETDEAKQKDGYHDTGSSKSEWTIPEDEFRREGTYEKNVYLLLIQAQQKIWMTHCT